jgi:sarcosine oxidase
MMGPPIGPIVDGSRQSATRYELPHELLDTKEIHRRFPALQPPAGTMALFEKNAGFIYPETSVLAHLERAQQLGARLQFEEEVLGWEAKGDGVEVWTARGRYQAQRLIITAGPWAGQALTDLRLPLQVERQVMYWFAPTGGIEPFLPAHFPVFILETTDGLQPYGFPAVDGPEGGVKVAFYRAPHSSSCTPATIDRQIRPEEIEFIREKIIPLIPALNGKFLKGVTCMYTNTPDLHFILDLHPAFPQVSLAAGFSGHGYKFCSVVGEVMADLAETGHTPFDLTPFKLSRFN